MNFNRTLSGIIAIALALIPAAAFAQGEITVDVDGSASCAVASWQGTITGGSGPYELHWDFGDTESLIQQDVPGPTVGVNHPYLLQGEYDWLLTVEDAESSSAESSGTMVIDGPTVTLSSDPFPPLLFLDNGAASASFTAEVIGGVPPYSYTWDLDGDGQSDPGGDPGMAAFTYSAAGKYQATVQVVDDCGLMGEASLPVVVIDPEDEEACHPMAQRIAEAVTTLFPSRAEQPYTCEDIYAMVNGALTGSQLGYGRLWHAYALSLTIEELTWEEMRDWKLDGFGWGGLVQLDRFADTLADIGMRELFDLVLSGDASIREIRHAVSAVVRYEADFEDALARLGEGMSPGELGRFYRTAEDLGVDAAALDEYLSAGSSLQELSHAARLAERSGNDWEQIAEAHASGYSWGEIGQAQRLADDDTDWMAILETGVRETRKQAREASRAERDEERQLSTAERLAAQYEAPLQLVLNLYDGECEQQWNCVRKALRDLGQTQAGSGKDGTAGRLANQYGVPESDVWSLFNVTCDGDWKCVREALRGESGKGGGRKP